MSSNAPARSNPFPGLRSFLTEEDYLFFGRDKQTWELLGLLGKHRFLAVVGTSGSGKSSLVRAGLLPSLQGGHHEPSRFIVGSHGDAPGRPTYPKFRTWLDGMWHLSPKRSGCLVPFARHAQA